MNRLTAWGVGMAVLCSAAGALAQEEEPAAGPETSAPAAPASASGEANLDGNRGAGGDKKIRLGLRLGYALPFGKVSGNDQLSDGTSGQIPIWIDAGYQVTPNVLLGVYGQYGIVLIKDCPSGTSCSAHDIRIGLQGQYHLAPDDSTDPWFGLGVGYEWLGSSTSAGGRSIDTSLRGFEFLNLQGGVDFQVARGFTVGPFASFSLGQFSSAKVSSPLGDSSGDVEDKKVHEWLTLGVKGTLGL